jgi:hypothetical protein
MRGNHDAFASLPAKSRMVYQFRQDIRFARTAPKTSPEFRDSFSQQFKLPHLTSGILLPTDLTLLVRIILYYSKHRQFRYQLHCIMR